MANKYYDGEITLNTDWGGDVSTGNLPVSGRRVQEVIKEGLNSKVGYVGLVERTGQGYYVLARDEETFNEYKKTINDEKPFGDIEMDGINGRRFDAPFNYKMNINFIGNSKTGYISKLFGSTNNVINFTAQTVDASNIEQHESVTITVKVINESGVESTYTQIYDYNKASKGIEYNLDGKLSSGVNTIIITAVGMNTGVSGMKRMTYRLVDIYFTDNFEINKRYQFSSRTLTMDITYSLKGLGDTKVRWFFDGNEYTSKVNTRYNNDPIVSNAVEKFVFTEQTDTWLQPGVHSLQMIMECKDINNGDGFNTPIYYREFIVENDPPTLIEPFILRKTSFEYVNEDSFIKRKTENETIPSLNKTKQFDNVEFEYAAYYNGKNVCEISTFITYPGGDMVNVSSAPDEEPLVYESFSKIKKQYINVTEIGTSIITLRAHYLNSDEYKDVSYLVDVIESDMKISTVTTDVALELNAFGRSNNSSDKNSWIYKYNENGEEKEITTKFYDNEYMLISMNRQDGSVIAPEDATELNTKTVSILPDTENKEFKYLKFNNQYYIWARSFDWSDTSGWSDNKLKLSNGNAITINYKPFSSDKITKHLSKRGGTFEFEFETTNVYNDNAVICRIAGENNYAPGISIYASGAELVISREVLQSKYIVKSIVDNNGEIIPPADATSGNSVVLDSLPSSSVEEYKYVIVNGHYYEWFDAGENSGYIKSVSTKYKAEESNRISFVITPDLNVDGYRDRILKIYVNGEICGAYPYDKGTNFINGSDITFRGSEDACVNIYSIKIYEKALTSNEILNNYIYYRNSTTEKFDLYKRNDIMLSGNDEAFDSNKLKSQLPVMTFYQIENGGSLDDIHQEKKNKKLTRFFDVVYVDLQQPSKNFLIKNAYVTPQGTSSMNYPVKNLRLYTGKKDDNKQYYSRLFVGPDIFIDGSPNNLSWDNINLDSEVTKRKYAFKDGSIPVNCWCLKADFAESSSSHNTGTARYWNGVLKNGGYATKAQVKTEANKDKYPYDVRTCIDGFPIAVFYQSMGGSAPRFEGKYNFNNDKSTESVFGFTGGEELDNQEVKYFYIGKEKPVVNTDDISAEEGAYVDSPTTKSPLYASDEEGNWYMLRGKELLDNPRMECWELLNSVNEIALFKTMKGFGVGDKNEKVGIVDGDNFDEAFESRYPDCGDYYHTNSLKRFGEWLVSCRYLDVDDNTGASVPFTIVPSENYHLNEKGKLSICSLSKKTGEFEFNFPNHNFYKEVEYDSIASNISEEGYKKFEVKANSGETIEEVLSNLVFLEVETLPSKKVYEYQYLKIGNTFYSITENGYVESDLSESDLNEDDFFVSLTMPSKNITEYEYLKKGSDFFTWMPSNLLKSDEIPSEHEVLYDYVLVNGKYYEWSNKFKFDDYHPVNGTIDTPSVWVDDNAFNRALKFAIEKYDHIEMDKMAAYYIYLMRFGGVDQTVKNAMLTTEGPNSDDPYSTLPSLWYFINYDNDTILGVKNDGRLVFDPYITRQTKDGTGYVYAGRESTLWNNLEEDKQFMDKVTEVDNKLANGTENTDSSFLLSYDNAIREYDINQSDRWCERIYNKDAERKYIKTYVEGWTQKVEASGTTTHVYEDYLYDVQGSRSAHRKWWLGRRFNVFDSRFCNANFRSQLIKFRSTNLPSGSNFTIKSGEPIFYAWGHDNSVTEITSTAIQPGNTCTFTTKSAFNIGSYLEVMGSANISSFDLRNCVGALTEIDITGCYSHSVGTKLKELLVGDKNRTDLVNISNTSLKFSGLDKASKLEVLDMTNIRNAMSFDGLNSLLNIREVYAKGTSVSSFEFANGSMIERIELPMSIETLKLDHSALLKYENIVFEGNNYGNLINLTIDNCSNLMTDHSFVLRWISKLSQVQKENAKLNLLGIKWTIRDEYLDSLLSLEGVGTSDIGVFNITGEITIPNRLSNEQAFKLQKIFGENCFKEGSGLYIKTEPEIFINMSKDLWEGDKNVRCEIVTIGSTLDGILDVSFNVYNQNEVKPTDDFVFDLSNINNDYVLITLNESNNVYTTLSIMATYYPYPDNKSINLRTLHNCDIHKRNYPQSIDIRTSSSNNTFNNTLWNEIWLNYTPTDINSVSLTGRGFFDVSWEIIGGTNNYQNYITLKEKGSEKAEIKASQGIDAQVTVKATITRLYDNKILCSDEKVITFTDPDTILTRDSNPELFNILVNAGIINVVEGEVPKLNKIGASMITIDQLKDENGNSIFAGTNLKKFLEFEYFVSDTIGGIDANNNPLAPTGMFAGCKSLTEISLSANFKYSTSNMFSGCTSLEKIYGPSSTLSAQQEYTRLALVDVAENFAARCGKLTTCELSSAVKHIGNNAFNECTSLTNFTVPSNSKLVIDGTPFISCPNIIFEGTSYDDPGIIKYCVKDGSLYHILDDYTANLIHMGKTSLMSNIPTDRTIRAKAYSMEYRTENNVVIPQNVIFDGNRILINSSGNSIKFTRPILENDGNNYESLLEKTKYNGNYIFSNGTKFIPKNCFNSVEDMTQYEVPDGVITIGESAFNSTKNLKHVLMPESIKEIRKDAFRLGSLKTLTLKSNTPPTLGSDVMYAIMLDDIFVEPEALENYKNSSEWALIKPFLLPVKLFNEGYIRIIKDGECITNVNDVKVGGLSVELIDGSYMKYTATDDNSDLNVYLNGDVIGKINDLYTTVYLGDNSSLITGDGYNFTIGVNDSNLKGELEKIGWFYDYRFNGVRTNPEINNNNKKKTENTFYLSSHENNNIAVKFGMYSRIPATNTVYGYFITDSAGTVTNFENGYNLSKTLYTNDGNITIGYNMNAATKEGINGIVINQIGDAIYSDPEQTTMARSNLYNTVEVSLIASQQIPNSVYVTLTDNQAYTYRKFYNGDSLLFNLPLGRTFIATSIDFITDEGKLFKLKNDVVVNENKIYLEFEAETGITIQNNILCYHADNTDWYINLNKYFGKWGNIDLKSTNTDNVEASEANGLTNTRQLSTMSTDSIFYNAITCNELGYNVIGFIPSFIEICEFSQYLNEINFYLRCLNREEISFENVWTSESYDENHAYNSNGEIVDKNNELPYYIFGKYITV